MPQALLSQPVRGSVSFAPKTVANLQELRRLLPRTSKTDIINRAIAVYLFIQKQLNEDATLFVRSKDGTMQQIHIL